MNKTRRITVYARQRNLPVPLSDLYEPLEFSLWNVGHKISRAQYRRWIKKERHAVRRDNPPF